MQEVCVPRLPLNRLSRRLRSVGLSAIEQAQSRLYLEMIVYLAFVMVEIMDDDEQQEEENDDDEEDVLLLALAVRLMIWFEKWYIPINNYTW